MSLLWHAHVISAGLIMFLDLLVAAKFPRDMFVQGSYRERQPAEKEWCFVHFPYPSTLELKGANLNSIDHFSFFFFRVLVVKRGARSVLVLPPKCVSPMPVSKRLTIRVSQRTSSG